MILLNGTFAWFKNLPELWQTVFVAAAIFTTGTTVGLFFRQYHGLPTSMATTEGRVTVLETGYEQVKNQQDSVIITMRKVSSSLDTIKHQVGNIAWQMNVFVCYQNDTVPEKIRACLADARNNNGLLSQKGQEE